MATTIKLDENTRRKVEAILMRPFRDIRRFWAALGLQLDRDAMKTFAKDGARGEHPRWTPLSMRTVRTPSGTARIRYGTDGTPTPLKGDALTSLKSRWGWGHIGEMRKGVRRYGSRMRGLLQASGKFKESFGIKKISKKGLTYGTNYELADDIMSKPTRNVLFITGQDETRYAAQFARWYSAGLRI